MSVYILVFTGFHKHIKAYKPLLCLNKNKTLVLCRRQYYFAKLEATISTWLKTSKFFNYVYYDSAKLRVLNPENCGICFRETAESISANLRNLYHVLTHVLKPKT